MRGRQPGFASQGHADGVEGVHSVFAGRREIRADDAEFLGAGFGAESADDFQQGLCWADILLRLIVGPGHVRVVEKAEGRRFVVSESIEQSQGLATFGARRVRLLLAKAPA